jgi:hypothetical protein
VSAYTRQLSAAARQHESESAFDEAEEAREEWIDEYADLIAEDLLKDEDFVIEALSDEQPDGQEAILRDVGRFFARFHAAPDDPSALASLAVAFYREVKPYVDAAAKERARDEAAKVYDSMGDE